MTRSTCRLINCTTKHDDCRATPQQKKSKIRRRRRTLPSASIRTSARTGAYQPCSSRFTLSACFFFSSASLASSGDRIDAFLSVFSVFSLSVGVLSLCCVCFVSLATGEGEGEMGETTGDAVPEVDGGGGETDTVSVVVAGVCVCACVAEVADETGGTGGAALNKPVLGACCTMAALGSVVRSFTSVLHRWKHHRQPMMVPVVVRPRPI